MTQMDRISLCCNRLCSLHNLSYNTKRYGPFVSSLLQMSYLCKIKTCAMAENNGKHTTINPEGKTTLTIVAILFFAINLPLFLIQPIYGWWSYLALGITLLLVWFFLHFFRNPVRRFPSDDVEIVRFINLLNGYYGTIGR